MKKLHERLLASLMKEPWFAGLPESVRNDVIAHGNVCFLEDGDRIYGRGEEPDTAFATLEGCAKLSSTSRKGVETVLDFYGPGKWFGETAALNGLPRINSAFSVGRTILLVIPTTELQKMLHKHPVFCRAILKLEATRLRIVLTAIAQYSTQPLEHRLANRLLMLISSFGNETLEGMVINLHLSQHTLSQLIGATRQMVNLILKRWSKQEIIQHQYGTITVTNLSRLKELASD